MKKPRMATKRKKMTKKRAKEVLTMEANLTRKRKVARIKKIKRMQRKGEERGRPMDHLILIIISRGCCSPIRKK